MRIWGDWRRLAVVGALLTAPMALGGCTLVSDAPLFNADAPAQHRLATGLWALSGPGCEVTPNPAGALPSCAAPMTITDTQLDWDTGELLSRLLGPAARRAAPIPLPKASDYVLADGDPVIIELINGQTNPLSAPGKAQAKVKPSYLALRVTDVDRSGRIDRGIMWPVFCPPPGEPLPAGLERRQLECIASTQDAVRDASRTLPPLMSYFMTWISATVPPPPPAPPAPATPESKTP